jgi:hypothetical protein
MSPNRGPAFLYVLPCAYEDLLKLGHSRDPLARMQAMHARWFEFFDLERGFAVATETVRDAQRLELHHGRALASHAAPAPLLFQASAGGATEWYRGAYPALHAAAQALQTVGHVLHAPLRDWARTRLLAQADRLHHWTGLLDPDALEARGAQARASIAQRRVVDVLDAYLALEIDLAPFLSDPVMQWHDAARMR